MKREALSDASAKIAAHLGIAPTRDAFASFGPDALVDAWDDVFGNPFTAEAVARGFDPRAPALKPFVDGDVIADHPFRSIGSSSIPLLAGSTTREINAGVLARRKDLEAIASDVVAGIVSDADAYARAVGTDDAVELLAQAISDRAFRAPLARLLEGRASHGSPTWAYQFGWGSATHCIDIPFAFDNLDAEGVTDAHRVGAGAPQRLADEMHADWVRFITNGDVSWPAYDAASRPVKVFDVESAVVADGLAAERELF